ncbi:uncharacterized protein LOC134657418 [Cydia amplana]|uniref:uncharacterized protein LOC134657418 n=1 Tax=Cydia amplana TaxID=1869771 RepID=UPI002FE57468
MSSDSEFESIASISNTATGSKSNKEKSQKRKPDASWIESDGEFEETTKQKKGKKTSKPKSTRTPSTAVPKKKASKNDNPFELFPEDEGLEASSASLLDSSIVQRVANGLTKRTLELDGAFFVELRVYKTDDVRRELPENRWKKALLSIKTQLDSDTPPWESLIKFTKHIKSLFKDTEAKFYLNKD